MTQQQAARFPLTTEVDFVIVGSGAAGGIMAKELSTRGHTVVVLEQGPRIHPSQFHHDEYAYFFRNEINTRQPITWRQTPTEVAKPGGILWYAQMVGGSSVHFTANFWRFRPVDFNERSRLGAIPGASLVDWPITYQDLEPYYTKVDWEIGVSGAPGPNDPPRSRPYPVPPLPVKSSGVLFERGARKLGFHPYPAPMAILSQPHNGRAACQNCGFCEGFGCEYGAKSSTLASMIPMAERTGKCEIRARAYVRQVEVDARGRATGVVYFDENRREQRQRAKAVILCANGAETPRLLLMSASNRFPNGLANSSGMVGKHLMFNGASLAPGIYEHPLNEYKGVQVTRIAHDWYDSDPKRGFYGGGGIDARGDINLPIFFALNGGKPGVRNWGAEHKRFLEHGFSRQMVIFGHTTSLPVESNSVSLDPTLKDDWGLPAIRFTYRDHDDDLKMMKYLQDRAMEIHQAAGATQSWRLPVEVQTGTAHLLGTCRMGNDPRTSVIDKFHRTHDVKNLFLCDGSSLVTSGRGQPTMTIMALAFRAGERIAEFAKRGEI
ncbi:MAG: GMC family oxidoreductase [Gemmatimonadaceae bacterium]|nr:GMC family oxidoreductase [Gemmatimonadaceae bacterium]